MIALSPSDVDRIKNGSEQKKMQKQINQLQAELAKKDEQLLKAKTLLRYHSELPMSENVKEFLNE